MADQSTLSLDRAPSGVSLSVVSVGPAVAPSLAAEGIVPGATLEIESAVPFGGPVVVRLGRARLAVGRAIARSLWVEPLA